MTLKEALLFVDDSGPFGELAAKHGSKITVMQCKTTESRGMVLLLKLEGQAQNAVLRELRRIEGIRRVYWTTDGMKGALAMVTMDTPLVCAVARRSGVMCRSCPLDSPQRDEPDWRVLVRDGSELRKCIDLLERHHRQVQIREISNPTRRYFLTSRQREIVLEAIRQGYFASPRRTCLTKLAHGMQVRPATLSEVLRRAERKMAEYYIESSVAE